MNSTKAPVWFWVISGIALVWNALGVGAYLQQAFMSAEEFGKLPPGQQDLIANQPEWVTAAFAIAVFAGFVGCILLLLRKKLAVRILILSFVAIVVQQTGFFMEGYFQNMSGSALVMPIMIPVVGLALIFFARRFERSGVLT